MTIAPVVVGSLPETETLIMDERAMGKVITAGVGSITTRSSLPWARARGVKCIGRAIRS